MSYKEHDPDYYDIVSILRNNEIDNSTLFINDTLGAQAYFKKKIKEYTPSISEEELNDHLDRGSYNCDDNYFTPTKIVIIEPDEIIR